MRLLPSFMLSLLLLMLALGAQLGVEHEQPLQMAEMRLVQDLEFGVDVLEEFEEEMEPEVQELSVHRFARTPQVQQPQEDRFELFGPPPQPVIHIAHVWEPPPAHVVPPRNPWPRAMLRPPGAGLPTAGLPLRA